MDPNSEKYFPDEFCAQIHTTDKVVQKEPKQSKKIENRIYNSKMAAKN